MYSNTVCELRKAAKVLGIKGYYRLKKNDLMNLIVDSTCNIVAELFEQKEHAKIELICQEVIKEMPAFRHVLQVFFTSELMCQEVVKQAPWTLQFVSDGFITLDMCQNAVLQYPCTLKYVPARFKTDIALIKYQPYTGNDDKCSICLETCNDLWCCKACRKTPFHKECILAWTEYSGNCPVCRE